MIGYLLFGGIVLMLAVAVIAAAVVSSKTEPVSGSPARARQESTIEALRALEFEFQTGKLAEEEYAQLRRGLELEAVRARDEARVGAPDEGTGAGAEDDSGAGGSACAVCGNDLSGGESFCPNCGAALR
jgi:hypothetical protein